MISKFFDAGTDSKAVLAALNKLLAMIEFDPEGRVLTANGSFCSLLGYDPKEIAGKHHSLFVEPEYARSQSYEQFWTKLTRGESEFGEYKRIGKGGKEVWIQASYCPVVTSRGKVVKIVKVASDVTAKKMKLVEKESIHDALSRVQGIIEFAIDGKVIKANSNFLNMLGYQLDEIEGRNHSMFVEPAHVQSADYRDFWSKLTHGEFVTNIFKRVGKGGKELLVDASYNPIFDTNGKVVKIVEFATDVTARLNAVGEIGTALEHLAKGDLFVNINKADIPFTPALEKLRTDFNNAADALKKAMWQVGGTALAIQRSTGEIQSSADELSKRTEQQAANLEETAAALDEITATVKTTAAGAKHACQVVGGAKVDAEHSGEVVRRAVIAMNSIEKSSGQISQIISVIDEIAFQTNLLALNAGVEAARAGDAGRGFAVVASEVRALAQRSAEAAKEIKSLIMASTGQVEDGVDLVRQTGNALTRIVEQVTEINGIIESIAVSAQEQSTALVQVNSAINQMDHMTQQNAAMVEQSTAATHGLSDEVSELFKLISGFRVSADNRMAKGSAPQGASSHSSSTRSSSSSHGVSSHGGSSKAVPAMKVAGRGGAARKPAPQQDDWEEF